MTLLTSNTLTLAGALMPAVHTAAPRFLVDNLEEAMAYYSDRLGFVGDFAYEGFHGSVARNGATIHLECAPKARGERAFRRLT